MVNPLVVSLGVFLYGSLHTFPFIIMLKVDRVNKETCSLDCFEFLDSNQCDKYKKQQSNPPHIHTYSYSDQQWGEQRSQPQTSFTYRFIVCKLQTCFILHCSFAEVNSWERKREREFSNRGRKAVTWVLRALSGPWFSHFKHTIERLNRPANRKGILSCMVSATACAYVSEGMIFWCLPPLSSSLSFVDWPLCGGFITPLRNSNFPEHTG